MSTSNITCEAIPSEDYAGGAGAHPYAGKPLMAFQSITAICNDCAHVAILDRDKLLAMTSVATFADLWRHAYCAPCRAMGSSRRRITLHGLLLETARRPLKPAWSDAKLFGDDRTDPFDTLPRRRMFA